MQLLRPGLACTPHSSQPHPPPLPPSSSQLLPTIPGSLSLQARNPLPDPASDLRRSPLSTGRARTSPNSLGPGPSLRPPGATCSFTLFRAVSPQRTFLCFDHNRKDSPATRCTAAAVKSARAKSSLPQRSRLAPKSSHASD